jgi:hypothetical protein
MCALHILYRGLDALYWHLPPSVLDNRLQTAYNAIQTRIMYLRGYRTASKIQAHHVTAYHNIMSQTYDDNLLDDGSSILKAILQATPNAGEKVLASSMMELVAYLFTPAASRRSAMTAARVIHDYKPSGPGEQI